MERQGTFFLEAGVERQRGIFKRTHFIVWRNWDTMVVWRNWDYMEQTRKHKRTGIRGSLRGLIL